MTGITRTGAFISWNASTDNVGVSGYNIYRDAIFVRSVTGTTNLLSGLSPSVTYSITLRSYDTAGNTSLDSSVLSITTLGIVPPAPTVSMGATPSAVA